MRTSKKTSKTIGVITAAAGLAASVQLASAQVWNNPTTGNWSAGANWIGGIAPAAGAATQLTFNATGTQTYTATNDIANPFLLNAFTLNNTGTGVINLAGQAISFGGANNGIVKTGGGNASVANALQLPGGGASGNDPTTISGAGTGVLAISGALSSNPASGGTAGGQLRHNAAGLTTNLGGGGTVYGLRVNSGSMNMTGGTWTLTSTERGNDPIAGPPPINDDGNWSISVGETAGTTARMDIINSTVNAQEGFWGNANGATGIGTISNSNVTFAAATGRFGINYGTGSLSIVNGSIVNGRLFEIGRQANSHSAVLLDGAATRLNVQQILAARTSGDGGIRISGGAIATVDTAANAGFVTISAGAATVGTMVITGGSLLNHKGQMAVATGQDSIGTVTIDGGSKWNGQGNSFIASASAAGTGDPIPATASVTVSGVGSQFNVGTIIAAGTTTVSGGQQTIGNSGPATLTIQSGATSLATNTFLGGPGHGTLIVSGTGSSMANFSQLSLSGDDDGTGLTNLKVSSGGVFTNSGSAFTSGTPIDRTQIDLDGGTLSVGTVLVASGGGGGGAGTTTINISNGGRLASERLTLGQNNGGKTTVNISGANSRITTAFGAGTGSWAVGVGDATSAATISVSNGAVADATQGALFMSGGITAAGGGTTVFNVSAATANFGFTQVSNSPGSVGTLNVNAGGVVNSGTSTLLGLDENTTSGLNVNGAGAIVNTPILSVGFGGQTAGTGDPLPGGTNFANVTGGGQINTTGLGVNVADSIDTLGTMVVSGTNSKITSTGTAQLVVGSDEGAVGTMNISNGGAVNMAGSAFISASTTSFARVTVNGGTLAMGTNLLMAINGGDDTGDAIVTATNNGVITSAATVVAGGGTLIVGTGTSKGRVSTTGDLIVNGQVEFNAGTLSAGGTLGVGGNVLLSSAARAANGTASNKKFVEVGQATLTTSGVIDLNDNDMLAHDTTAGAKQKYEGFVKAARNGGLWNMPGITSSAAKTTAHRNLGVISGAEFTSAGGTTFNGKAVLATDTLIKFTFNGDTDLNGTVDFDDYSHVDNGFNNNRTGWFNGDFDYNGVVDFDDYSLIDQAFNNQGSVVLNAAGLAQPPDRAIVAISTDGLNMIGTDGSMALRPTHGMDYAVGAQAYGAAGSVGGNLQAVPEPTTLGVIGIGMLGALRRRRRHV